MDRKLLFAKGIRNAKIKYLILITTVAPAIVFLISIYLSLGGGNPLYVVVSEGMIPNKR